MQRHRMLDALLVEEELMPCTFSVDAADLGYLDPLAAQQQHLAAGTQVRKAAPATHVYAQCAYKCARGNGYRWRHVVSR